MNSVDLTYIIPVILLILSILLLFIYGKAKSSDITLPKFLNYIPLFSVIGLLAGVFYISSYYKGLLEKEEDKFNELVNKNYNIDSIFLSNISKTNALDSLNKLNKELERILSNITKQEKITGKNPIIRDRLLASLAKTKNEIKTIEEYNEIIPIPKYLDGGYSTSGNTSNFVFQCPSDKISEYVDLKLIFQDELLINKIDCIYLTVLEVKSNNQYDNLFSQAYKPKKGVNLFKIKNYLKMKNILLEIGYIMKSDIGSKLPKFQKISCRSV